MTTTNIASKGLPDAGIHPLVSRRKSSISFQSAEKMLNPQTETHLGDWTKKAARMWTSIDDEGAVAELTFMSYKPRQRRNLKVVAQSIMAVGKFQKLTKLRNETTNLGSVENEYPKSNPVPDRSDDDEGVLDQPQPDGPTAFHNKKPDMRDVGTPDEWITRDKNLERVAGRHPFNSEPPVSLLVGDGGKENFLTPGHLHFTRNHGAVPQLEWDAHKLEIVIQAGSNEKSQLTLTMDDLVAMPSREFPMSVCCIGNRRAEQNAVRRSVGFSWGTGAISTSYFQGVPLRQVLLKAGVSSEAIDWDHCHVEFLGADVLPNKVGEGPFEEKWGPKVNYGTSVPLPKAMDPARDMLLAYKANGEYLPPDRGYPLRVVVPGYTGARMVKWLKRITVIPHESHNLYHHHDNKIFPPHVIDLKTSLDKEKRWWYKSEYIVYDLNINSVICKPDHRDVLEFMMREDDSEKNEETKQSGADQGGGVVETLDLSGYAYAGGGRRVNRVEYSLDGGVNWDLTIIQRYEKPTEYDMHWCWIFWHAVVPVSTLTNCEEIWVRAWDETNNTQPLEMTWNLMGLGNNQIYRVKVNREKESDGGDGKTFFTVSFEHPTQPGGIPGGWMKQQNGIPFSAGFGPIKDESTKLLSSNTMGEKGQEKLVFPKEEISKQKNWIVVKGKVYDCTEYFKFHPGGQESILIYGGKDCTKDFEAVHSDGATALLENYWIGVVEGYTGGKSQQEEYLVSDSDLWKIREAVEDANAPHKRDCEVYLAMLDEKFGQRSLDDSVEYGGLDPAGAMLVSEGWPKIVKNYHAFSEALLIRWRLLVAVVEISEKEAEPDDNEDAWMELPLRVAKWNREACLSLQKNEDPIAVGVGGSIHTLKDVIMTMLYAGVVSIENGSTYHSHLFSTEELEEMGIVGIDPYNLHDYGFLFNSKLEPRDWLLFCETFLWALSTHMPGATPEDLLDLRKPHNEGHYAAFVSHRIARVMISNRLEFASILVTPSAIVLQGILEYLSRHDELRSQCAQTFFTVLFECCPQMFDYFQNASMDWLARTKMLAALSLLTLSAYSRLDVRGPWKNKCRIVDRYHTSCAVAGDTYAIFGWCLLKVFTPLFQKEEKARAGGDFPVTAEEITSDFSHCYLETANSVKDTRDYLEFVEKRAARLVQLVADDMEWSKETLERRLYQIKPEISENHGYDHEEDELQLGCKIAWRDSADDANRKFWKDLVVLDRRNANTKEEIAEVVEEHLKLSKTGNCSCGFTILPPKKTGVVNGLRFWGSNYFMYAGYKGTDGMIIGDPSNIEYTSLLLKYRLWKAPKEKGHFDLLPIVFKTPGRIPFAYTIPNDLRHDVKIEHPECKLIEALGVRWPAYDFVSNVYLKLGGVDYQCCSFNQVHIASRVSQELLKWPGLFERWTEAMQISRSHPLLKKIVPYEIEVAVLYSFKKAGYPIMDDIEASESFLAHCNSERAVGRRCLSQQQTAGESHHKISCFQLGCSMWKAMIIPDGIFGLDGLLGHGDVSESNEDSYEDPKVLILYGSETGTGEQVARRLRRCLKSLNPIVMELNSALELGKIVDENKVSHVIGICSTVNRGEFPHNAAKFSEEVQAADHLIGKKFAVLALGNSIYPNFCAAGVRLNSVFVSMGGEMFHRLTKIDGKDGSEAQIEAWLDLVTDAVLPKRLRVVGDDNGASVVHKLKWLENTAAPGASLVGFQWPETEGTMVCIRNDELLSDGDIETRSTRRIDFRLPPDVTYESGDHLAVQPLNSLDMVKRFALCFETELLFAAAGDSSCDPGDDRETIMLRQLERPFEIESFQDGERVEVDLTFATPCTLSDVLQAHVDLTIHEPQLAELIQLVKDAIWDPDGNLRNSNFASEHKEEISEFEAIINRLKAKDDNVKQDAVDSFLQKYPTIVNFLERFRFMCAHLKLATLLQSLPRLHSRYYSISSSPRAKKSTVSISVGVVRVTTSAGTLIRGVCSNYLATRRPNSDRVKVSVRSSTFRGPKDQTYPVVMVGQGTGLAPMMGFLEDRAMAVKKKNKDSADCHLFFGCRTPAEKIYTEAIESWRQEGVLKLHLALSRSPDVMPKTYVQDLLEKMGDLYKFLVDAKSYVYVCGDAKVANACYEVCIECLRNHGRKTKVQAVQHLKIMSLQKRWQCDLWGAMKNYDNVGKIARRPVKVKKDKALNWLEASEM